MNIIERLLWHGIVGANAQRARVLLLTTGGLGVEEYGGQDYAGVERWLPAEPRIRMAAVEAALLERTK